MDNVRVSTTIATGAGAGGNPSPGASRGELTDVQVAGHLQAVATALPTMETRDVNLGVAECQWMPAAVRYLWRAGDAGAAHVGPAVSGGTVSHGPPKDAAQLRQLQGVVALFDGLLMGAMERRCACCKTCGVPPLGTAGWHAALDGARISRLRLID
jgi:hypothetical protein